MFSRTAFSVCDPSPYLAITPSLNQPADSSPTGLPPDLAALGAARRPHAGLHPPLHPPRPPLVLRDQGGNRQGRRLSARRALHEGNPRDAPVWLFPREHSDPRPSGRGPEEVCCFQCAGGPGTASR